MSEGSKLLPAPSFALDGNWNGPAPAEPAPSAIEKLRDLIHIQGIPGTIDQGDYMVGLYNGLQIALGVLTGEEPQFRDCDPKPAPSASWEASCPHCATDSLDHVCSACGTRWIVRHPAPSAEVEDRVRVLVNREEHQRARAEAAETERELFRNTRDHQIKEINELVQANAALRAEVEGLKESFDDEIERLIHEMPVGEVKAFDVIKVCNEHIRRSRALLRATSGEGQDRESYTDDQDRESYTTPGEGMKQ